MNSGALDGLIPAVTTIFVLSLAVERMASLLKGWDWQPLRPMRASMKNGMRVNLARSSVVHVADEKELPVADIQTRRDVLRAVITENTVVLGMALALSTGTNAFEGMPGVGHFSSMAGVSTGCGLSSRNRS